MMEFVPNGNVVKFDALETGSGVSGVSGELSGVSGELSGVSGEKVHGSFFKNLFVKRIEFKEKPDDIFPL